MNSKNTALTAVTDEIVESVLELLKDDVYSIILYGSYARGEQTAESDIDVMVLLNCSKEQAQTHRREISLLSGRLGLKNDVEISLLLRDRETFRENIAYLPFYRNISAEGVVLYGEKSA